MLPLSFTQVLLVSLFFFYALSPLTPSLSYNFHNGQRLAQIFLLTLLSISLIRENQLKIPQRGIVYPVAILLLISLISSLTSNFPLSSFLNTLHYVLLLTSTIFIINTQKDVEFLFIFIFFIHTCLIVVCTLNIIFAIFDNSPIHIHNIIMKFDNIRHFNHFQVLILPLGFYILSKTKLKILVSSAIILNLLILAMSNSLAALVCYSTILFLYFIFKLYDSLKSVLLLTTISLFLYLILIITGPEAVNKSVFLSDSGRVEMWMNSIPYFKDLLLGIGVGNYQVRLDSVILSHPHNSFIQVLVEQGFISLIICFYLLFMTIFIFFKNKKNSKKIIAFITFITAIVYSLFSGLIVMPTTQIIFVLIFSQLIECEKTTSLNNKMKIFVATTTLVYFTLAIISFYQLEPNSPKMAGPSFWSAGEKNLEGLYR